MFSKTFLVALITCLPLIPIVIIFWSTDSVTHRLPRHIWPIEYNITIQPFLEDKDADRRFNFSGDVQIRIRSVIKSKYLVMHSRNLNYSVIEYWNELMPSRKLKTEKMIFDFKTERIRFQLENYLLKNHFYILNFKYTGIVSRESVGMFVKEYKDANNHTRQLLATQFQPNEARSVFPCFDEPQFKATFRIKVVRPKHMSCVSNAQLLCSHTKDNGLVIDTFKSTPKMSSYTLALIISSLKEEKIGGFSVIAAPEKFNQTQILFELAPKILDYFSNIFKMNYYEMGVDKLTIAVLPELNFFGMENWGLITIRENSAFNNKKESLSIHKENLATLLGHEIAHIWFGNIVTCDWWNSIWLNEGFATYFSGLPLDLLGPKFSESRDILLESGIRDCMKEDVGSTQALNYEQKTVSRSYFSTITYWKGASVVKMIKHIIGERNFKFSIQTYLQINKYKTVTPKSLQTIIAVFCPANISNFIEGFFESYVEKAGYPLLNFNFFENSSDVEVTQERFPASRHEDTRSYTPFTVPITFTTNIETNFLKTAPNFFLTNDRESFKLESPLPVKWLIANVQSTWYYRVNYNKENWIRIAEALRKFNFSGIPVLNRMQIVDDIQHLFCVDKIDADSALNVLEYLSNEINYLPWRAALKYIENVLRFSKWKRHNINDFMLRISEKVYESLGFINLPTDKISTIKNRQQIVPFACKYGNIECLERVKYYFENHEKFLKLPIYLRLVVYSSLIRENDRLYYGKLLEIYHKNNTKDKYIILKALGCVRSTDLIELHFWNILEPTIPHEQKPDALKSLYSESDDNAIQVFKLITNNFEKVIKIIKKDTVVAQAFVDISKRFSDRFQKKTLEFFVRSRKKIFSTEAWRSLEDAQKFLAEDRKCY